MTSKRTACVSHSIDIDGWLSAAIVKKYYMEQGEEVEYVGFTHGQELPDLSMYERVVMCDIAFPRKEMMGLAMRLKDDFIWIDHHISAIKEMGGDEAWEPQLNGLRDVKFAACELTWRFFYTLTEMPEFVRLCGRYDCFGHKGTDEEMKVLEFQYFARSYVYDVDSAGNIGLDRNLDIDIMLQKGKDIYKYLVVEAKQVYKNGFVILLDEPRREIAGIDSESHLPVYNTHSGDGQRKFICFNRERFNPVNFGLDYHADGYDGAACFYYDGKKYNFSIYNDNGKVNCSEIAKTFGGGGHAGASGFIVDDLKKVTG